MPTQAGLHWPSLLVAIVLMLFGGVVARYVFSEPLGWIDEAVSIAFIWVAMLLILRDLRPVTSEGLLN